MKCWENCTVTGRYNDSKTHTESESHWTTTQLIKKGPFHQLQTQWCKFLPFTTFGQTVSIWHSYTCTHSAAGQVIWFPGPRSLYSYKLPRFILFGALTVLTQRSGFFFNSSPEKWVGWGEVSYSGAHAFLETHESVWRMVASNSATQRVYPVALPATNDIWLKCYQWFSIPSSSLDNQQESC